LSIFYIIQVEYNEFIQLLLSFLRSIERAKNLTLYLSTQYAFGEEFNEIKQLPENKIRPKLFRLSGFFRSIEYYKKLESA